MLDYTEILNYSKTDDHSQEGLNEDPKYKQVMANLKAFCSSKHYKIGQILAEKDKVNTGLIERKDFSFIMKNDRVLENPNEVNLLANYFRPKYSNKVNYKKLVEELNNVDDPTITGTTDHVSSIILKYVSDKRSSLKSVFEENSVNKKMDFSKLQGLIKKAGYSDFDPKFLQNFLQQADKAKMGYISFYQFLSLFKAQVSAQELYDHLKPHAELYNDLKAYGKMKSMLISKLFENCKYIIPFAQEIENIAVIKVKNHRVKEFCALFEDVGADKKLDIWALRYVEDILGGDINSHRPKLAPNTSSSVLKVPNSEITFESLKKLKKVVQGLDSEIKFLKSDYKTLFKKYDQNSRGMITEENFM